MSQTFSFVEGSVLSVYYPFLTENWNHFGFSYMMEKVDLVLVGAEGVVESGGIINKVSYAGIVY